MAYVVRRPRGRWEVRESFLTPAGPRSRTLVSFTALTPEVLDRAVKASRAGLDPDTVRQAARRAGAPFRASPADELTASLMRSVAHGAAPRPGLARLLTEQIVHAMAPARVVDDSLVDWIGSSAEERGDALLDLLDLTDRLPKPPRKPLTFPGLSPARLRR